MSAEILAILVLVVIVGVVLIAFRIRSERDKESGGLQGQLPLSETAEKRQIQASIKRLENRQAEISKRLDQILETKPKEVKPKAVKKKTAARKTTSKPKAKKA